MKPFMNSLEQDEFYFAMISFHLWLCLSQSKKIVTIRLFTPIRAVKGKESRAHLEGIGWHLGGKVHGLKRTLGLKGTY